MDAHPDPVVLYRRAAAAFGEQVVAIGDDEWDLPTPCPEWNVKAVVAHVVVAEAQLPDLVEGRAVHDVEADVSVLGPDPVSAWRGTALRALELVGRADLDQIVHHMVGDIQLGQVVGFRITENLVHAWDLATARGNALELDPELAEWCLDFWLPYSDALTSSDAFGPILEPADDRPGTRLLALLGRTD